MMPALTPTTGYRVVTVLSGRPVALGALSVSVVPVGWLTSVHFMSNAHSMVRPAITLLSAAMRSTAVQAAAAPIIATRARVAAMLRFMVRSSEFGGFLLLAANA